MIGSRAGVVGVICVRGSRRLWGHILMRTDLVGASFGSEELAAIEGFSDQLGLVFDGADLLGRSLEVERSLAHREKLAAIGELTARVAHEIRNPATAARSLAQQLVKEEDDRYQVEHSLILESLDRRIDGLVDAESRVEGKVAIEAGAEIIGSVIRGPAIIGANARIEHAYVGPYTSIMNDVEIRESELEHSIVLEGSVLSDLANRVIDSLIGRNVRIIRQPVKPSAYRFMLGDNSEVGIRW